MGQGCGRPGLATLQHTSNLYYTPPPTVKLAKSSLPPYRAGRRVFGNSGAEANEGAIKCARKYSVDTYGESRNKVITLVNSFHGRTLATLTATGQDVFHHDFGPFPGNFDYVPAGDFRRAGKGRRQGHLRRSDGTGEGEGGVVALDADYVAEVAAFCRERHPRHCGRGADRRGPHRQVLGVRGSLTCTPTSSRWPKGLGGGLPIGAVLMNKGRRPHEARLPRFDVRRQPGLLRGCAGRAGPRWTTTSWPTSTSALAQAAGRAGQAAPRQAVSGLGLMVASRLRTASRPPMSAPPAKGGSAGADRQDPPAPAAAADPDAGRRGRRAGHSCAPYWRNCV